MNENAEEFRKIAKVLVMQLASVTIMDLWLGRRNPVAASGGIRGRRTAEALPPRSFWCWWRRSSSCRSVPSEARFHGRETGSARGGWLTLLEGQSPHGEGTACVAAGGKSWRTCIFSYAPGGRRCTAYPPYS